MDMTLRQKKAMLAVGSLVYSYCRNHDNCERDSVVNDIISNYKSKIARGCKVNLNTMESVSL